MKRCANVILVCLAISLALSVPAWGLETPVTFDDPNLKDVVKAHLEIEHDPLPSEMLTLTGLNAAGAGIKYLTGLETATNLVGLDLGSNQITNLNDLEYASFPNLQELNLRHNAITDISAMGTMTLPELLILRVRENQLTSLSGVQNAPKLQHIDAWKNQISDVSALQGLSSLIWLELRENRIQDIGGLLPLPNLNYLGLRANQIQSIPDLSGLATLFQLDLGSNPINDMSGLSVPGTLTALTMLNLSDCGISDLQHLAGLTGLTELGLGSNNISDLQHLAGLTGLTVLGLGTNNISNLGPLADLKNLTSLDLTRNKIIEVGVLGGLTELHSLRLSINDITDISGLDGLNPFELRLSYNEFSDITVIGTMTNLDQLRLTRNNITDIGPLANCGNLQDLRLERNAISDVGPLSALPLGNLLLQDNRISDISPLAAETLTTLRNLDLTLNPLNQDTCANIPMIQANNPGVNIQHGSCDIVTFGDDGALKQAVIDQLAEQGITTSQPTRAQMECITFLAVGWGVPITDFTGLECAVNLDTLGLSGIGLQTLPTGIFSQLPNLWHINISGNNITDISPLAEAPSLGSVHMHDLPISDIGPLASLPNLRELIANNTLISDISPLTNLQKLQKLDLLGCPLNENACATHIPQITANNPGITILQNACIEPDSNLISNGDFEAGDMDPWHLDGPDGAPPAGEVVQELIGATVPEGPIEGNSCLHLTVPDPGQNPWWTYGLRQGSIFVPAGKEYTLSFWLKCKQGTLDAQCVVRLQGGAWTSYAERQFTMTDTWAQYSVTTPVLMQPISPCEVKFHIGFGAGEFWIDDIRLTGEDGPLPEPGVLGNWEDRMDGWQVAGGTSVSFNDTTGVTRGDHSLEVHVPSGWQNVLELNLIQANRVQEFADGDVISLDITRLAADWPTVPAPNWSNVNLAISAGGDGWDLWEGLGWSAHWVPEFGDQTQTGTWSYGELLSQIDFGNLDWLNLIVISNCDNEYAGEVTVYLDNMQLGSTEIVTFGHPNLKQAVIDELAGMGIQTDNPTTAHMAQLESLSATGLGIDDLTGLEHAVNVGFLNLKDNNITDASPLSGLTNLWWLNLSGNPSFSDLQPLAGLTSLKDLRIWWAQITDLSPIAGLTGLQQLWIQGNSGLASIAALENMTALEYLQMRQTSIVDLSPLAGCANLREICADHIGATDLTPLAGLSSLESLDVSWSPVSETGTLPGSLKTLKLTGCQISDVSGLAGLSSLVELYLASNQISDIAPLASLGSLQTLYMEHNQIIDPSPIANLPLLTWVYLWDNQINDVSSLAGMIQLTGLTLGWNQINDPAPLVNLTSLTRLSLDHNPVSDVSVLSGMTDMRQLWLNDSQISDIGSLSGMLNLEQLHLENTLVSELGSLLGITTFTLLHVQGNPLTANSYCGDIEAIQLANPNLEDFQYDAGLHSCEQTEPGGTVDVTPVDTATGQAPVTITFEDVTEGGYTNLTTSQTPPAPLTGFQLGNEPMYYDISTTASFTGLIDICISYDDSEIPEPEAALRLYHYEDGQWVDCTTALDTQTNIICGATTSLSPFAIVQDVVSASPETLWPVDHKMVEVTITVDPAMPGVCRIVDVTCNEFVNDLGDGDTDPDWEITGDLTVQLRAERAGGGNGRIYQVHVECTDPQNDNAVIAVGSVNVTVPHDQS